MLPNAYQEPVGGTGCGNNIPILVQVNGFDIGWGEFELTTEGD